MYFKMSLTSESKAALGRENFELFNVCIYLFFGFGFFKGNQCIALQLQPAWVSSFNHTHPFFHPSFSAIMA